jgi:hypothetical protein
VNEIDLLMDAVVAAAAVNDALAFPTFVVVVVLMYLASAAAVTSTSATVTRDSLVNLCEYVVRLRGTE